MSNLIAGTSTTDGIAGLFSAKVESLTKALTGAIAARQDGISTQVRDLGRQIDAAQARVDATEKVLRARFNNLEQVVGRLQSTGNSLLANLSKMQQSMDQSSSSS